MCVFVCARAAAAVAALERFLFLPLLPGQTINDSVWVIIFRRVDPMTSVDT